MSKSRVLALGVYLSQALLLGGCEAAEPVADDPSELYVEELVIVELEPVEAPVVLSLFDFRAEGRFKSWRTVDDRVMGGVSRSRMVPKERFASFQGDLSLENNGGFASVRSPQLEEILEEVDVIRLRVRGDGRIYQLSIRTDRVFDGVRYGTSFQTEEGAWMEVRLPLDDFRPTWRGRTVPGAPALLPEDIRSFGFMVTDKQEGDFRLDVESLSAE